MMPPRLELTHSTHKMMVAPPRINLRRAASYNAQDRGPLSSTSSRFNFNHLLFSPPPSPSLPALVPRPKKSPKQKIFTTRPSRVIRRAFYLLVLMSNFYCLAFFLRNQPVVKAIWPYFTHEEFEMVGQDELPQFATPIVAADPQGHLRWTVSIPQKQDFPMSIQEYADMSSQCREVSARARDLHHRKPMTEEAMFEYDAPDDYFVDVDAAEEMGILPPHYPQSAPKVGHLLGVSADSVRGKPVCHSTMTFILEGTDAGLGNTIMMLWTFYGLAKEQGRAFFIDDSRWAYGDYSKIFTAPPVPECRPPPRHHMLPCPFQASHLLVTSATAKDIFPALLAKHQRTSGAAVGLRDLFELARVGYEALSPLFIDDRDYVDGRIRQLKKRAMKHGTQHPVIGYHVRRGDRHPLDFQYYAAYIPAEVYQETSERLVTEYYKTHHGGGDQHRALTLLASDDPTVKDEPMFSGAVLAQERIRLAVEEQQNEREASGPTRKVMHDFEAEPFGWEGGFYASMFWNLGEKTKNNAPSGDAAPSELTLKLRNFVGRAYMMDLAVLAGASDHVVCGVSAMGCRLLAVMMGWERAMEKGGWVNVDGDFAWTGIEW
ncbi:hypothetical protein NLU13_2092 [Sarocladium strictum]|uniref:Uncharacterized protein n=1 Tax=Sarocladium strictum TaxID=5046 RepID=A0AA39LCW9_SARSR|nr:hypothetical protein NLU13_2092 [Sarocladium strictum]